MLNFITRMANDDLYIAIRAAVSGSHNKKIRLSTAAKYKKKLENLFKYESGKYGAMNTTDTATNEFYVIIFSSEAYTL